MAERRGKESLPQVQWKEEKRVLTLEKIPVLEMDLSVPQLTGGGRGGERISRYYQRLAGAWPDGVSKFSVRFFVRRMGREYSASVRLRVIRSSKAISLPLES